MEPSLKDSNIQMLLRHWQAHALFQTRGKEKTNMLLPGNTLEVFSRGRGEEAPHQPSISLDCLFRAKSWKHEALLETGTSCAACSHTHTAISGQRDWQQPAELASQELQHLCMPRAFPGGDDLQHTLCTCSTDGGTDPRNTTLQVLVALLCLPIV